MAIPSSSCSVKRDRVIIRQNCSIWKTIRCTPSRPCRSRSPPNLFDTPVCPSREELIEYYGDRTGLPTRNIDYYMVFARFKLATLVRGIADREG